MKRMDVTLIEDDAGVSDALQMLFKTAGFQVTAYRNGNEILDNNFKIPDIFIIDRQLRGIDGLDICRFLKSNTESKSVPVIIVSASPVAVNAVALAGADVFIEKPFTNKVLLEKMRMLVLSASEKEEQQ
jgi:DNA-binding response OmpR family regulator